VIYSGDLGKAFKRTSWLLRKSSRKKTDPIVPLQGGITVLKKQCKQKKSLRGEKLPLLRRADKRSQSRFFRFSCRSYRRSSGVGTIFGKKYIRKRSKELRIEGLLPGGAHGIVTRELQDEYQSGRIQMRLSRKLPQQPLP